MAEIAVELDRALAQRAQEGSAGKATPLVLAQGDGWKVLDVICTSGPHDRPFEEQHSGFSVAFVLAGSFQYRSPTGRGLMTPGSVLLGNAGQSFECGHEHARGDRCISFWFAADCFERLAFDAGARGGPASFGVPRLPPAREMSPLIARAAAALAGSAGISWEELGVDAAATAMRLARGLTADRRCIPPGAEARVTRALRRIQVQPADGLSLGRLARAAGLSPYHFLRTFERVTGTTPHQFVLRTRLREAALRVARGQARVLDIALDSGFNDASNFNRAFRAEFGMSPRRYRSLLGRR